MTAARSLVSLIVLNHNGEQVIDECLESVLRQDYPRLEIIVVDNASNDDSPDRIRRFEPRIRMVRNAHNLGYAGGFNAVAPLASEDSVFLAFVTNDVILAENWVTQMVNCFQGDPNVGAVSSRAYERRWKASITDLKVIYPIGTLYIPWNRRIGRLEIDCPSGQAFIVRRHVFERVGGFDPRYFAYYEEVDLGWRIRLDGYTIIHSPDAIVSHLGSVSLGKLPANVPTFLSERNRMTSCLKNLNSRSIVAFLVAESANLAFRALRSLLGAGLRNVDSAYVLGLVAFARSFRSILRQRERTQKTRRRSDKEIFTNSTAIQMKATSTSMVVFKAVLALVTRLIPAT